MKKILTSGLMSAILALMSTSATAQTGMDYFSHSQGIIVYKGNNGLYGYDLAHTLRGSMVWGNMGFVHVKNGLLVASENNTNTGLTFKLANKEWYTGSLTGGQQGGQGAVCFDSAYVGSYGASAITKINPDNGNVTTISSVGTVPWGVSCGTSVLHVLDEMGADAYEVDSMDSPGPANDIGVFAEQLSAHMYDQWDGVLWVTRLNAVREVILPGYTYSDPITLPELATNIDVNQTHVAIQGNTNAYLINKSAPGTVITLVAASSPSDVALCGGYVYVASSSGVQVFDMSGVEQPQLTPDSAWSVACVREPTCGNGDDTDFGEECDDGGTVNGDGCSSTCQLESAVCGNGVLENGEDCDDSDTTPGDGCDASCLIEADWKCDGGSPTNCQLACGDGVLDPGEDCDDGSALNSDTQPDACRTDCTDPGCGDDVIDSGEGCDDGAGNSDSAPDACRMDCQPAGCGDDVIDSGEDCDGTAPYADTCESLGYGPGTLSCGSCSFNVSACSPAPGCGDGDITGTEGCDDGDTNNGDGCGANCQVELGYKCSGEPSQCVEACGDGVLDTNFGEECDDGNGNSDTQPDACRMDCTDATCGDGVEDSDEECDDGNSVAGDGCDAACNSETAPVCGDGVIEDGEACDDGNTTSGDGCSAVCQTEADVTCTGEPSNCTIDCPGDTPLTFLTDADLDLSDRSDLWLAKYDSIKSNDPTLINGIECFLDENVVYVRWTSASRSIGAIDMGTYTLIMQISPNDSGNAHWEFPVIQPEGNLWMRGGERLMIHSGVDVFTEFDANGDIGLGTQGTADWCEVTHIDPKTGLHHADRLWVRVLVTQDLEVFKLPPLVDGGDPQYHIVAPDPDGIPTSVEITNPTTIYDKPEYPDPPPKDGCPNCSTGGGPASIFWALLILGLILRRRKSLPRKR